MLNRSMTVLLTRSGTDCRANSVYRGGADEHASDVGDRVAEDYELLPIE